MEEIRAKCLRRCICRNVTFRPICVTDIGNLSNDFDNSLIRLSTIDISKKKKEKQRSSGDLREKINDEEKNEERRPRFPLDGFPMHT